LDFVTSTWRPWRTSWLMVGMAEGFPFRFAQMGFRDPSEVLGRWHGVRGAARTGGGPVDAGQSTALDAEKPSIIPRKAQTGKAGDRRPA
jgi:hypothetical protein